MADADSSHSTCHPNTRTRILQQIKDWAHRKIRSDPLIIWLRGAAGSGKTAIARTIASWCEVEGILLGEFFFSRAHGVQDQIDYLVATLAYRMATLTLPAAKETITLAVIRDPHIFSTSLANQMTKLVLEPLNNEAPCGIIPYVIILDGLDECLSAEEQDLVLDVLSRTLHSLNPDLRILICSRPEPTISTAFNAPHLQDISTRISLSDDIDSDADIRIFLVERFAKLLQHLLHPPIGEWPTAADIAHLVQKSSGQFIFASTVVKYVSSPRHRHNAIARLKHVLDLKQLPPNAREHPFAELDALYTLILSTREVEEIETTVKATAICLEYPKYFSTISPEDLAMVLQLELTQTQAMLDELASLFDVTANNIRPFHASFSDYLYEPSRSGNFYCDRRDIVNEITYAHLQRGHDPDILSFQSFVRLLDESSQTEGLQNILNQMDPSSIFSGDPFDGKDTIDGYYLIPLLQQLQRYVSFEVNKKLLSYFDRELASHVTGLFRRVDYGSYDDMPELQSVSSTGFSDASDDSLNDSDEHSDADSRHGRPKGLLIQQTGEEHSCDEDDHNFNGSEGSRLDHPRKVGRGNTDEKGANDSVDSRPTFAARMLVLVCTSPAWDRVATGLNIVPTGVASFRSICNAAPFVHSHLPRTLSVLLGGSRQADAARFCLQQLRMHRTKDNLMNIFAELLPHSLSHAGRSLRVVNGINSLFRKRHKEVYKGFPSSTWESMSDYISRYQPNILHRPSPPSQHRPSPQQPSGTSKTHPLAAPRTHLASNTSPQSSIDSRAQQPSSTSQGRSPLTTSRAQRLSSVSQGPSTDPQTQRTLSATLTASRNRPAASTSKTQQPSTSSQGYLATLKPPSTAPQGPSGASQGPQSMPRNPTKPKRRKRRRK